MAGEGADVTLPTLDVEDFIGTSFTTGPDGKLYQLPTQQFANLYWFRYDWFNDEQNKADFKAKFGYDLGVPVNWSAYEDIAEFFTGRDLSRLGVEGEVFGNMDYGKKDPSWVGAILTRGCPWLVWETLVSQMVCRLMNGVSV